MMSEKNTTRFEKYRTKSSGITVALPVFIPVYRPDYSFELFSEECFSYGLSAVMVNSFLLYRESRLKTAFEQGYTLREHLGGFSGVICTDSGAFQQLGGRKVGIDPLEIVRFQNTIQTDIAAPLDLITPPDTDFDETKRRMIISQYRIREALEISDYSDLAGIQQGGGFFSLRQKHIRQLADSGIKYYGIGSMVPFFNKNHDLTFTCSVISDARAVIGQGAPMHVYGAGDPLDIAFMFLAGANIFDSSSYAHYAQRGYYMTPYGAINKRAACETLEFSCSCPVCSANDMADIFDKASGEHLRKKHNLFSILKTIRTLKQYSENRQTETYISAIYDKHVDNPDFFPGSLLAPSWEKYLKGETSENAMEQSETVSVYVRGSTGSEKKDEAPELTVIEKDLIEFLARESAVTYKMEPDMILKTLEEELMLPKNMNFRTRINTVNSLGAARRLSEYKAFRKETRGSMYQKLRQYKASGSSMNELLAAFIECGDEDIPSMTDRLLEEHVSTRERLPNRNEFADCLCKDIKPGSVLIDIGCGFGPLIFPAKFFEELSVYIAVDRDAESVELVRIFAKRYNITNLKAFTWNISSGLSELRELTGVDHYDVALLLQIIPVLSRIDQNSKADNRMTSVLGEFPAKKLLATVSRESMTKYESIKKREAAILRQFALKYGFGISSDFSCGGEFGYYLEKLE